MKKCLLMAVLLSLPFTLPAQKLSLDEVKYAEDMKKVDAFDKEYMSKQTCRWITVFGSARTKSDDASYIQAYEFCKVLGQNGYGIITGGGPGIMEAANKGAHDAGTPSVGFAIKLPREQCMNGYVSGSVTLDNFSIRKESMVSYAEAIVVFSGGYGTLDEIFDTATKMKTFKIRNVPFILVGRDYWGGLVDWLRTRVQASGNINGDECDIIIVVDTPEELLEALSKTAPQK